MANGCGIDRGSDCRCFTWQGTCSAPEDKKQQRARELKIIAIIWMAAGVLLYVKAILQIIIK